MVFRAAKGFRRVVMTAVLLSSCHGLNEGFKACLVDSWVACFSSVLEMPFFFSKNTEAQNVKCNYMCLAAHNNYECET